MSYIEENDNEQEEEFQTLISQAQTQIKYIEKQIGLLIPIKIRIMDASKEEEKEITQKLNNIYKNVNKFKNKNGFNN